MNYDAMKVWVDALQFLWIIGATVWAFWGDKNKETKVAIGQHDDQIADMDVRVARIEEASKFAPTHNDIGGFHDKLNSLAQLVERVGGDVRACKAEVGGMRDVINPLQNTIQLVNEYLLNKDK